MDLLNISLRDLLSPKMLFFTFSDILKISIQPKTKRRDTLIHMPCIEKGKIENL